MKAHFYIPKMFHPFGFSSWKSSDPKIIATRTYLFENFSQKRPPKILSELFWVKIHLKWAVIPCYPRRGRKARNFTTNVPKILDLKSSSEQIFFENWLWVPLVIRKCCFLPGDVVFPVVVSVVGSKKKKKKSTIVKRIQVIYHSSTSFWLNWISYRTCYWSMSWKTARACV